MDNEYLDVVKEDAELYGAIMDALPALQKLSAPQIERLVFYLKSLHTYYPKSENHTEFWSEFDDKLERIRNSPEQKALQRKAGAANIKAMAICALAGVLLAVAAVTALSEHFGIALAILLISGVLVLFADTKFLVKAKEISKEQDRKYFLSSIREAKGCNELNWAGLFAYRSGIQPKSETEVSREIGALTADLRAALYNDEYFSFSPEELRVSPNHDA